jgi:hypothetical protein
VVERANPKRRYRTPTKAQCSSKEVGPPPHLDWDPCPMPRALAFAGMEEEQCFAYAATAGYKGVRCPEVLAGSRSKPGSTYGSNTT